MKGAIDTGRLRPNTGRTNQKLFFARLQWERMSQVLAERATFSWEAEALSCREAVILHLHGAYVAFLQELVRFYKLPDPVQTSEALRLAMAARGQVAPEISRLQQLEQAPSSWLAQLLRAYRACLIAPDPVEATPGDDEKMPTSGRINLVADNQDEPLAAMDVTALQRWLRELTDLIREFRREREEF
jgi:hypothetical protein